MHAVCLCFARKSSLLKADEEPQCVCLGAVFVFVPRSCLQTYSPIRPAAVSICSEQTHTHTHVASVPPSHALFVRSLHLPHSFASSVRFRKPTVMPPSLSLSVHFILFRQYPSRSRTQVQACVVLLLHCLACTPSLSVSPPPYPFIHLHPYQTGSHGSQWQCLGFRRGTSQT